MGFVALWKMIGTGERRRRKREPRSDRTPLTDNSKRDKRMGKICATSQMQET
jgi:hypothetical protein